MDLRPNPRRTVSRMGTRSVVLDVIVLVAAATFMTAVAMAIVYLFD